MFSACRRLRNKNASLRKTAAFADEPSSDTAGLMNPRAASSKCHAPRVARLPVQDRDNAAWLRACIRNRATLSRSDTCFMDNLSVDVCTRGVRAEFLLKPTTASSEPQPSYKCRSAGHHRAHRDEAFFDPRRRRETSMSRSQNGHFMNVGLRIAFRNEEHVTNRFSSNNEANTAT
jgi:hypothetical protein